VASALYKFRVNARGHGPNQRHMPMTKLKVEVNITAKQLRTITLFVVMLVL
jgi:hypothetical protein